MIIFCSFGIVGETKTLYLVPVTISYLKTFETGMLIKEESEAAEQQKSVLESSRYLTLTKSHNQSLINGKKKKLQR